MKREVAKFLLESLIERIDRNAIGTISSAERDALGVALKVLMDDEAEMETVSVVPPAPQPKARQLHAETLAKSPGSESAVSATDLAQGTLGEVTCDRLGNVDLVTDSLARSTPDNSEVLLCLDFGTAMSKAFAQSESGQHFELELGAEAGQDGYAVPSSVFITEQGKVLFGFEAVEVSQELDDSNRMRLDSIKSWLSQRSNGDLDAYSLSPEMNPTTVKLSEGDLIRIYLAYLTDLAVSQVQGWSVDDSSGPLSRYIKRRFAHPCWPSSAQKSWADRLMRRWMAEAQILADTFHGKWEGGIDVALVKAAVDKVKALNIRPDYLIADGVPEPVAVAAGALADGEEKRLPFMVIDVGAGTTDFGLFLLREDEEREISKVFQIPGSIKALMQAGDRIDMMLKKFILDVQGVDPSEQHGRLVAADLSRRIRGLKERLFASGLVQYVLMDGTRGKVELEDFMASRPVKEFSERVEQGFKEVLDGLDDTWVSYLTNTDLTVVLSGGGANLPMMKSLAQGWVEVKGRRIARKLADPLPGWISEETPELELVYPQLAVAIGGAAHELPETVDGPEVFGGGGGKTHYVVGRMQVSGP